MQSLASYQPTPDWLELLRLTLPQSMWISSKIAGKLFMKIEMTIQILKYIFF